VSRTSFLIVLLALYVGTRLAALLTNVDEVAVPVYEVPSMGTAAWLAATGWRGVPWSACYDNAGGQLLTAWLAAPLYALLGQSYVALKLVPFLLGAGLLVLVWRTVQRAFGTRAANISGLFVALAPPLLFKYSLLAKGNHFEGLCFVFVPVWLWIEAEGRPRRARWMAAVGLAAGLAVSVYVGSLATLAALGLALALTRPPRETLRDTLRTLPGFLVGILPAVALHLASEGRTGSFIQRMTSVDERQSDFLAEARETFQVHLPRATCSEPLGPLSGQLLDHIYLGAALVAAVGLFVVLVRSLFRATAVAEKADEAGRRNRRVLCIVTLVAPLVALAALLFTPLRIRTMPHPAEVGGLRYFVPSHFWALVATGLVVALASAQRSPLLRTLAGLVAVGAGLASLSSLTLVRPTGPEVELALSYPGRHLRLATTLLGRAAYVDEATGLHTYRADEARVFLDAVTPMEREEIAHSLGSRLFMNAFFGRPELARDLDAVLRPVPAEDLPQAAWGVGALCATLVSPDRAVAPPAPFLDTLGALLAGPHGAHVAFGLGTTVEYPLHLYLASDFERALHAALLVPPPMRPTVVRGLGYECARRIARGASVEREAVVRLAEGLEPADRTPFWEGVAAELARHEHTWPDPSSWVPATNLEAFLRAFTRG
jgi:4-amino-4-deoxy-L-arabinose transferase-like glycosyltransferase